MGVCDCLDSTEDKPSLGNGCAKLHSATRWERAAGVCVLGGVRVCIMHVCRNREFYFYLRERVVTYISSHPRPHPHLSLPTSHSSLLSCSFLSSLAQNAV